MLTKSEALRTVLRTTWAAGTCSCLLTRTPTSLSIFTFLVSSLDRDCGLKAIGPRALAQAVVVMELHCTSPSVMFAVPHKQPCADRDSLAGRVVPIAWLGQNEPMPMSHAVQNVFKRPAWPSHDSPLDLRRWPLRVVSSLRPSPYLGCDPS